MAAVGAHVVLAGRTTSRLEDVSAAIKRNGGAATTASCDVGRAEDVDRLFEIAVRIGPPAALVCAAAVLEKTPIDEITPQVWEDTLRINLTGAFLCSRKAFSLMRGAGGGRIVTLGSLSGVYATEKFPGLAAYNVSKYGVVGLTEALAVEGKAHGISAICISPGAVDTELLRRANPNLRPGLKPADVAALIVTLFDGAMVPASGANIPLFSNA
jgi:NAD(P)-dependent dehydrogenase (short-subunit alcohol dehydrogenase family)